VLGRNQSEIRHQLAWVLEAREITNLGNNGDRYDQADAAHGLYGFDDGTHRPGGKQAFDLRRQALDPRFGILYGVDIILQHDLLGGMIEPDTREPSAVGAGPALFSRIDAPMRKRKPCRCWRALPRTRTAVARARIRSRIASCASSGNQNSSARLPEVALPA